MQFRRSRAKLLDDLASVGSGYYNAGAAVAQEKPHLLGREPRIERQRDRAGAQDAQVGKQKCQFIRRVEGDSIAFAHSEMLQPSGKVSGPHIEVVVRIGSPPVHQRGVVASLGKCGTQRVNKVARHVMNAFRFSRLRPCSIFPAE